MIFVTVGQDHQGFDRLIIKMDEIAGKTDEEVIMQIGYAKYEPKNANYFRFIDDNQEIRELNRRARVIVCHAGGGCIMNALAQNTPIVAVPRLKKYGEHINDHQLEIARKFGELGIITPVYDLDELEKALREPNLVFPRDRVQGERDKLVKALRGYLQQLDNVK